MENASKALIIAGSILVALILIGLGILVVNMMNPVTDTAGKQADAMAVQTFNAQFIPYEGNNRSAAQVRAMKSAMEASNAANPTHKITVPTTAVTDGKVYTVTLKYTNGYVTGVTIK